MFSIQIKNRLKIIQLAYATNNQHLGSALSAVDIVEAIFQTKKEGEKFVLSAGHCVYALYAVLINRGIINFEKAKELELHPKRNQKTKIDVSTGSLGLGLPIATGMALADRSKNTYCLISDGECFEGSTWESLRAGAENNLSNLIVAVNVNGYSAYRKTQPNQLREEFKAVGWRVIQVNGHNLKALKKALFLKQEKPRIVFARTRVDELPFLDGLDAHYHKLTETDYQQALKRWSNI